MTLTARHLNRLACFAFVLLLIGAASAVAVAVLQGPNARAAAIPIAAPPTRNA